MVDTEPYLAAVVQALQAIDGLTTYDGYVPDDTPATGEFVDPYVVLWAGAGDNPDELPACGTHSTDSVILDFQTTVVAATPGLTRAAARAVNGALTNLRAGTGKVRPNPDGFTQAQPVLDPSVNPARFIMPLPWRLITN